MSSEQSASMEVIYEAIRDGADAFLMAEYKICFVFVGCFSGVIYGLIGVLQEVRQDVGKSCAQTAPYRCDAPRATRNTQHATRHTRQALPKGRLYQPRGLDSIL